MSLKQSRYDKPDKYGSFSEIISNRFHYPTYRYWWLVITMQTHIRSEYPFETLIASVIIKSFVRLFHMFHGNWMIIQPISSLGP